MGRMTLPARQANSGCFIITLAPGRREAAGMRPGPIGGLERAWLGRADPPVASARRRSRLNPFRASEGSGRRETNGWFLSHSAIPALMIATSDNQVQLWTTSAGRRADRFRKTWPRSASAGRLRRLGWSLSSRLLPVSACIRFDPPAGPRGARWRRHVPAG